MNKTLQIIIVVTVVTLASIYAIWRTYSSLKQDNHACSGCPLKNTCNKKATNKNYIKNNKSNQTEEE